MGRPNGHRVGEWLQGFLVRRPAASEVPPFPATVPALLEDRHLIRFEGAGSMIDVSFSRRAAVSPGVGG